MSALGSTPSKERRKHFGHRPVNEVILMPCNASDAYELTNSTSYYKLLYANIQLILDHSFSSFPSSRFFCQGQRCSGDLHCSPFTVLGIQVSAFCLCIKKQGWKRTHKQ